MRQAAGTLPLFTCTAALVVRDILALSGYNTAIVRSVREEAGLRLGRAALACSSLSLGA